MAVVVAKRLWVPLEMGKWKLSLSGTECFVNRADRDDRGGMCIMVHAGSRRDGSIIDTM